MSRPKNHHYVPQWYLKGFIDPQSGCLHAYNKVSRKYWKTKPKNVMVIKDYYHQQHVPEGVDPDIFEKILGESLENQAKIAFRKLLNPPLSFTEDDTANILVYLELQHIRVPRQAEDAKRVARDVLKFLTLQAPSEMVPPEAKSSLMRGEIVISIKDAFRFNFMNAVIGELNPYFGRMAWEVSEAPDGRSFITSDSPVTFFNVACVPPIDAGLALVGTIVFFPLDSQHVLVLRHPEYIDNPSMDPLKIVPKPEWEDGRIGVNYEVCDENQVNTCNRVILELSDRVVIGSSWEILEKAVDKES
jgi:Protein of unknown function (DUF4238)